MPDPVAAKRIEWIDYARVISIILIIIAHTHYLAMRTKFGGIPTEQSDILTLTIGSSPYYHYAHKIIYEILSTFRLPLLFLISGIVYSISQKKRNLVEITRIKFRRLIIPFICSTLFLSIPIKYLCGYFNESTNIIRDIILGHILLMSNSHLWFLVTLFIIFILYHIIDKLTNVHTTARQCFILLIGIIMYSLSGIMPELLALDQLFQYFIFFAIGASPTTFSIIETKHIFTTSTWKTITIYWLTFLIAVISYRHLTSFMTTTGTDASVIFILDKIFYIVAGISGSYGTILVAKAISSNKNVTRNPAVRLIKTNSFKLYRYSDPFNYLVIFISTTTGYLLIEGPMGGPIHCMTRLIVTITAPIIIILLQHYIHNRITKTTTNHPLRRYFPHNND